ncbi:hypothetical protein [Humisphaera borealis]|uniref:Uncharacterized protein n=1 Tax=Humisphaera borealis TaxID=2807512 RepID=A0A7M2WPT4_9BACT|nr:hypothetical protein [Humisphaera borealis]QOV87476.1 hypothetical protein IPV69_14380 [Humisphaera borealis]
MRTALIMFGVLLLSAGGFYLYLSMQAPTPRLNPKTETGPRAPLVMKADADTVGDVGPGARPWVKVYDTERRLSYRFRAEEYAPERAGRIDVKNPEAEFFQYVRDDTEPTGIRTQRIKLVGKTGEVEIQQGPQASADKGFEKGSSGPPKRGLLNDVTIRMFHRFADAEPGTEKNPVLTIKAPNVSFDNETFEIATRGYRNAQGEDVPADQVPIEATGDYNFRGRGLTLRWNDVDGRLDYLEVAHGEYLQIMNPGELSGDKPDKKSPVAVRLPMQSEFQPLTDDRGAPVAMAQVGKTKVGLPRTQPAKKPEKTPQAATSKPPYRATFERDVRVSEGDMNVAETQIASADLMYVDFRSGSDDNPATQPSTRPATQPASKAGVPASLPASPATNPSVAVGGKGQEPEKPKTQPATQPVQQPIIVRWSGKLRIVPLEGPAELPTPIRSGESILRFVGKTSPVKLARDLNRIDCTAADYFSGDRSVMVRGSERHGPVVLQQLPDPKLAPGQSRQATIVTQSLNYDGKAQVAVLNGKSNAIITMPGTAAPSTHPVGEAAQTAPQTQPVAPPQIVTARWNREGRLKFKNGIGGDLTFERADFSGDVDVVHPQLALKSQELALMFEEHLKQPTTAPALAGKASPTTKLSTQLDLKQVIATTDVWADIIDDQGRKQTVTTDRLTVDTATADGGKIYPKVITAIGSAHAYDDKQSLRAGGVELTMIPSASPATQPTAKAKPTTRSSSDIESVAVELKSMRAWDGVLVSSADGSMAAGQTMNVDVVNGQMLARVASPLGTKPATVADAKGNTVSGPQIDFDPNRQWARVSGRGSIRAFQAESPAKGATTRPATLPAVAATQPAKPPKFVDIFWETQAELDGAKDRVLVEGPVLVTSTDPDGTLNTARGKRAVIELAAKPPEPSTKPAKTPSTKPSTKPSARPGLVPGLAGGGMDILKDKAVTAVNLEENAVVNSTLSDDTGILRQFELKSAKVRYETGSVTSPATQPAEGPLAMDAGGNGRLIVPGPGTMIYRDHRPATRPSTQPTGEAVVANGKPAASPEPGVASAAPGQARGATAFQWKDSLVYDQPSREATMLGDVVIVHQPDGTGELPVRVTGDRGLAIFEPKPLTRATTNPAATPAAKPAAPAGEPAVAMNLKRLTMNGNLVVFRGGSEMTADRMMYDPATGWMTAYGTARQPATYAGTAGESSVLADEIHWNAQSWLTKFVGIRVRSGTDRNTLGTR